MHTQARQTSILATWWNSLDRPGWRSFGIAMLALAAALVVALFSAAVAQTGRFILASITAVIALALAAWVGITILPVLARRSSLRWVAEQVDYRLTREGMIYLGAVFVLVLACVNTGNNLLFMILACCLAAILISGVLSRVVLAGINLKFDLPEHIFAEQPVLAELELRNEKALWPSFSLRIVSDGAKNPEKILTQPVFFPFIPRLGAARQKVELGFPRRGVYRQDSFGIRTRFPFGFFEKTRRVGSDMQIVVYPHVAPTEQLYEVLPLLSGEMASHFRGRGHELHSLRDYATSDSARFVDWKVSAKSNRLMVREFAREDERRVMLVLDPFIGPPQTDLSPSKSTASAKAVPHGQPSRNSAALNDHAARFKSAATPSDKLASMDPAAAHAARFEGAVEMAACIAWHFNELDSVMQFRTHTYSTRMAPASEIIYDALRELAMIQPETATIGGEFLDELASEHEIFKIILTARSQKSIPSALWSSSYFLFIDAL